MPMVEFFDYELSADAYKARLLLNVLGIERTTRLVESYPSRENRSDWFLAMSPRGELPVIRDDGVVIDGVVPILIHLARRYDPTGRWYPERDESVAAALAMWLDFGAALAASAGAARRHDGLLEHTVDIERARADAHDLLRRLDEHLWFAEQLGHDWLCPLDHPTIADIACFPDVMLAEEGRVLLHEYNAVRRWTDRVKGIPGFSPMPGIFPL
jgi:glutathione S-transferase